MIICPLHVQHFFFLFNNKEAKSYRTSKNEKFSALCYDTKLS